MYHVFQFNETKRNSANKLAEIAEVLGVEIIELYKKV